MIVYCNALPGTSVAGATLFVTERSASVVVCTLTVAESLIGNRSSGEETVAVPESVDPEAVDESTFETTVKIACDEGLSDVVSEQVTVPLVPMGGVMHDHPAGGATETNVVDAGSGRLTEAVVPVLGPLFVTINVHVRFVPAFTGFGDAASVMLKSDCVEMMTSTCAELSLSLGSGVVLVIVAVVLYVPAGAVGAVEAVIVKDAVPGASVGAVQLTVPLLPTDGFVHDQPAAAAADWKRTPEGSGNVSVMFNASSGPSLLTLIT